MIRGQEKKKLVNANLRLAQITQAEFDAPFQRHLPPPVRIVDMSKTNVSAAMSPRVWPRTRIQRKGSGQF